MPTNLPHAPFPVVVVIEGAVFLGAVFTPSFKYEFDGVIHVKVRLYSHPSFREAIVSEDDVFYVYFDRYQIPGQPLPAQPSESEWMQRGESIKKGGRK